MINSAYCQERIEVKQTRTRPSNVSPLERLKSECRKIYDVTDEQQSHLKYFCNIGEFSYIEYS